MSVELDDSLEAGFSFLLLGLAALAAVASALGLIAGRHIVRVGVNQGPKLIVSSHGYNRHDIAHGVAGLLVTKIEAVGVQVIDDWNQDPQHWLDRIEMTDVAAERDKGTPPQ